MTRDELLKKICPWGTCDCGDDYESCNCDDCNRVLEEWLYDYEKQIRAKAINDYYNKLNEKINTDTRLKDTIREIHDKVAQEMYCKAIDEFANWLVEQGILGNRCISDGEITDYGKVYAKKYKEQLKAVERMSDLISRSEVNEVIDKLEVYTSGRPNTMKVEISVLQLQRLINKLKNIPTAYDIDKVVEELKQAIQNGTIKIEVGNSKLFEIVKAGVNNE